MAHICLIMNQERDQMMSLNFLSIPAKEGGSRKTPQCLLGSVGRPVLPPSSPVRPWNRKKEELPPAVRPVLPPRRADRTVPSADAKSKFFVPFCWVGSLNLVCFSSNPIFDRLYGISWSLRMCTGSRISGHRRASSDTGSYLQISANSWASDNTSYPLTKYLLT